MDGVLHEAMAKGVRAEGAAGGRPSWLTAPLRVLRATDDALEFGDWRLPYAEIYDAELAAGQEGPIGPKWVLALRHQGARYRFGLDREPAWLAALPLEVRGLRPRRRSARPLSLAIRVAFVLVLAWWVVRSCATEPPGGLAGAVRPVRGERSGPTLSSTPDGTLLAPRSGGSPLAAIRTQ